MSSLALSSTIKHTPTSSTSLESPLVLLNSQTPTTATTTIRSREKLAVNGEKLNIKVEGRARGDLGRNTRGSVGHTGGDLQLSSLSEGEVQQTLIPSLDDGAHSDLEFEEGLSLARTIEDAAVLEGSSVMNTEGVPFLGHVDPITRRDWSSFHDWFWSL